MSAGQSAEKDARPPYICEACWGGDHSRHRPDLGDICIGCACDIPPADGGKWWVCEGPDHSNCDHEEYP